MENEMPEKITGTGFRPTEAAGARRADSKPGSSVASQRQAEPSTGDTVELTRSARLLSRLEDAIAGASALDTARVKALKDAVDAGTYAVDADAVAERMIAAEHELGI